MMKENGQTLITLLFIMVIGLTVTASAALIIIINASSASTLEQGTQTFYLGESGAEDSLLRIIRDPSYEGGSFTVDSKEISSRIVTGLNNSFEITSTGSASQNIRTIKVNTLYNNNVLEIESWKELE